MSAERPPYVEFYYRAVEDRTESLAQGHYVTKDVAFAKIWRAGSRDCNDEDAKVWITKLEKAAREGMIPETWPKHFNDRFEAWKKGEEIPLTGTPIKGWPIISPAAGAAIIKAGYLTVEDLANAPDQEVTAIGMGAISFKQKAKTWLEQAANSGKVVERLTALEIELASMKALNAELAAENAKHKANSESKTPAKV